MNIKDKYDIGRAIDNIKKIMHQKDIGQKEIEAITGVTQSNISNILNKKKNSSGSYKFFSVEQLVALSSEWGVSVDELLGLKHGKRKENMQYRDVFKKLCEIDACACFFIDKINLKGKETPCLYFKDDVLNKMLKEWSAIETLRDGNDYTAYENIKKTWQENALSNQDFRPFYWQYKTRDEQGLHLMCDLIKLSQENPDLNAEECAEWALRKNIELVDNFELDNQIAADCRMLLRETIDEFIVSLSVEEQRILKQYIELTELEF